jgi:hypothetical protein
MQLQYIITTLTNSKPSNDMIRLKLQNAGELLNANNLNECASQLNVAPNNFKLLFSQK